MLSLNLKLIRSDFSLDVDIELPSNKTTVIFGRSGSGKSTLLRCIAGLERAQGRIQLNDNIWQQAEKNSYLKPQQRDLGYVFQEPRLFPHLNVSQNIVLGLPHAQQSIDPDIIALLKLERLLQRRPEQLSGGEQRRVSIARALIRKPSLLMLDEPLAGIDLAHRQQMLPYIQQITTGLGIPVLYVTHHLDEVVALAENLVLLEDGRIKQQQEFEDFVLNSDEALKIGIGGSCIRLENHPGIANGNYYIAAKQALIAEHRARVAGKVVMDGCIDSICDIAGGVSDIRVSTATGPVRILSESHRVDFPIDPDNLCAVVVTGLVRR